MALTQVRFLASFFILGFFLLFAKCFKDRVFDFKLTSNFMFLVPSLSKGCDVLSERSLKYFESYSGVLDCWTTIIYYALHLRREWQPSILESLYQSHYLAILTVTMLLHFIFNFIINKLPASASVQLSVQR